MFKVSPSPQWWMPACQVVQVWVTVVVLVEAKERVPAQISIAAQDGER